MAGGVLTCMYPLRYSFMHVCTCAVLRTMEHDFITPPALTEQLNYVRHRRVEDSKAILL